MFFSVKNRFFECSIRCCKPEPQWAVFSSGAGPGSGGSVLGNVRGAGAVAGRDGNPHHPAAATSHRHRCSPAATRPDEGKWGHKISCTGFTLLLFKLSSHYCYLTVFYFLLLAAQGVHCRAQAPHRQAAEDRTPAGWTQPARGGDSDAALHRGWETIPGYQRGGERSCSCARRGSVPVCTGTSRWAKCCCSISGRVSNTDLGLMSFIIQSVWAPES